MNARHRHTPIRLISAAALFGAVAVLLASCGSSTNGLIPAGNAEPLQSDFEAVTHAAESGNGNCHATESALGKTEQDFLALPASVDRGLRARLSEGIENLRKQALTACLEPTATATTSTSTSPPTRTSTERKSSTSGGNETTSTTGTTPGSTTPAGAQTTPTTSTTTTPPGSSGGTEAGGEAPAKGGSEQEGAAGKGEAVGKDESKVAGKEESGASVGGASAGGGQ